MSRRLPARRPAAAAVSPAASPSGFALWQWAGVFAAVLLAYWPALSAGFVWDDNAHVTRLDLRSWDGLVRIWTQLGATQQYYPVLHSAFWIEHRLWGDAALGYHLLNLLLHAAAAGLFGTVLRRLAVPGAWFAALLFALHPVGVESVAWISEQKNTLSTVFYLGAALAYLRFDDRRESRAYALATSLFVLALLTKSVTATLPAAILVVLAWKRGKLAWRRDVGPLAPWLAASVVAAIVTSWVERSFVGAHGARFDLTLLDRILLAGRVVWFYLGKLLWPANLIFIYPRWKIAAGAVGQYLFPLGVLAALTWLWLGRRKYPALLAGALYFVGTLVPALGFVNVYPFVYSFVADHFQYLASLGIFALAAAGAVIASARFKRLQKILLGGALLAVLAGLTWRQCRKYHDVFTLYAATIERNPDCWMAENNLAGALTEAGRAAEAVPHVRRALELRPDYAEAENNLGEDLKQLNRPLEAIPHLERALRLQPDYAEAHNNLGVALMMTRRPVEGLAQLQEAVRLKPGYALADFNLGIAFASQGRVPEAVAPFRHAIQLDSSYRAGCDKFAAALQRSGRGAEARLLLDAANSNP